MAEDLDDVKIDYPGLLIERLPSGAQRYRVRVEGDKTRRIPLAVAPDHPQFRECYLAARRGIRITPEDPPEARTERGSIAWATYKHEALLETRVAAGTFAEKTLKQRQILYGLLRADCGEYALRGMPPSEVVRIRDEMADRPAWADKMVGAIRMLFEFTSENGWTDVNPAIGVAKIDRGGGGAVPWTIEDLHRFRAKHPPGSMAHLALTLFMFTGCRISDAVLLGRGHEFIREGLPSLGWDPVKRGSSRVEIPILPPLYKAIRDQTVQGSTYLLSRYGRPFQSSGSLDQMMRRWCRDAGLENRSSHGIRKGGGHLLAHLGCSQHQIMAVHGHSEARTSEIYTRGVERWRLAKEAMLRLQNIDWS